MPGFIAYYRVSTDRQGQSALGLDAQREAVARHLNGTGELVNEYTEVESGKRHTNRPQLLAALAECRKRRAVLLIAKLDRLGRNVAFIASLMDSGAEFVACDNPHANRLLLHMLAAFAEHEREQISERTKAALRAAKARGTKLGNPKIAEARARAIAVHHARRPAAAVVARLAQWRREGMTLRELGRRLDREGVRPPRGGQWYASSVRNLLAAVA